MVIVPFLPLLSLLSLECAGNGMVIWQVLLLMVFWEFFADNETSTLTELLV
jgi:hypothetical protein